MTILDKFFGDGNKAKLRELSRIADKIQSLESKYERMSDEELKNTTSVLKGKLEAGKTLDSILPEAFAAAGEAAARVLGMRPYRVQYIGGIVLHQGRIAEMRTGEGKSLTAVMPAYLNGLTGDGVHIVTVNEYLAKRDAEEMGKVLRFLGLSVGYIKQDMPIEERKAAYACDVTYGTNNEFGFDYLRDNMALHAAGVVQRPHAFAIVDEVDSILIDEARTPLIISGKGEEPTELYVRVDAFVRALSKRVFNKIDPSEEDDPDIDADYVVDEKAKAAMLTQRGVMKAEQFFQVENLTDLQNTDLYHLINQSIRAYGVMHKDVDYVVKDGKIVIVDEFTGRLMFGRRYSEGLMQSIEAKESLQVASENKTLASITFQNYFRLYKKLSGMTGTASTEKEEFGNTYGLDVVTIPTNRPVQRVDLPDAVFTTEAGKYRAVVNRVKTLHDEQHPVLIGTSSVAKNEMLSAMLREAGIPHKVLNAKNHEQEAAIIAQAGKMGAVTVATNMAGRGTDILLGGNPDFMARQELIKAGYKENIIVEATGFTDTDNDDVLIARAFYQEKRDMHRKLISLEADRVRELGGLYIIGTERHESRRIDNQLRGRAGRQGDPGTTQFFISAEDDLMRHFGTERLQNLFSRFGVHDDEPIENKSVAKAIQNCQENVEAMHFQARKNVLEYDDVMNRQREIIYGERNRILRAESLHDVIASMQRKVIEQEVAATMAETTAMTPLEFMALFTALDKKVLFKELIQRPYDELAEMDATTLTAYIADVGGQSLKLKESSLPEFILVDAERFALLKTVDHYWMDHIDAIEELKKGVGLRAYAQKKPIDSFREESYEMFNAMTAAIQREAVRRIMALYIKVENKI